MRASRAALVLLGTGAFGKLLHAAVINSMDMRVYWRAVSLWLAGQNPYAFFAADQGFVFKYPPWSLPAFLPFAPLSETIAEIFWALVLIFSILYAIRWVMRAGVSTRAAIGAAAALWWIWLAHASSGQFTVFLLLISLWAFPRRPLAKNSRRPADLSSSLPAPAPPPWKTALLAYFLSFKVFPLIQLFGVARAVFRPKVIALGLALLAATETTALLVLHRPLSLESLLWIHQQWAAAAASGGQELPLEVIRGRDNLGFTALVARALSIPVTATHWDSWIAVVLGAVLGVLWHRSSRKLPFPDRWVGWIGVGLVIQPLAWNHSFVLAYPICALALGRAFEKKARLPRILAGLGVTFVGLMVWQIWGMSVIRPLELLSIKSWGVLLCAISLVLSGEKSK